MVDLSNPIRSVIPSAHGAVLAVLARSTVPLSGRGVAELAQDVSKSGVQRVLDELTAAGVVLAERRPPARFYTLNREHVAADGIIALAGQRSALFERMRARAATWRPRPVAVWLFGSGARGVGGVESDIDVLVVRPEAVSPEDEQWRDQLADFAEQVTVWSGNGCEILELSDIRLREMVAARERLVDELRADAIVLTGESPARLLRGKVTAR